MSPTPTPTARDMAPQEPEYTSPSPPPAPPPEAPPTANTTVTGPPELGVRAARLQKLYLGALSSSIQSNSYANFSACFPTPAKYCPAALEGVWKQLNQRLEEECKRDFDKILEERSVVEGLNQWDALIEDARRRKREDTRSKGGEGGEEDAPPRPMHSLSADELYSANLNPFLQQAHSDLAAKLQECQRQNQVALSTVQQQQNEIESLVSKLEAVVADLEGSVAAMTAAGEDGQNPTQALKKESWTIHQEVTASRGP